MSVKKQYISNPGTRPAEGQPSEATLQAQLELAARIRSFLKASNQDAEEACQILKRAYYQGVIEKNASQSQNINARLHALEESFKDLMRLKTKIEHLVGADFSDDKRAIAQARRRWRRAKVHGVMGINDFTTGVVIPFPLLSLSAGGCLVEGHNLPSEFQFSLEISTKKTIWGSGRVTYRLPNGQVGIQFEKITPDDEQFINQAVLSVH